MGRETTAPVAPGIRRLVASAWSVLLIAVIVLSLLPAPGLPTGHGVDKALHLVGYFFLAVLPFAGFSRPRLALGLSLLMLPLGIGLEFVQDMIPGRVKEGLDMVANGAGVFLGLCLGRPARRLAAWIGTHRALHHPLRWGD